ncbi:MAG TPA: diacylglycerol kinase family protein [Ohtaekwangia sp.]|nr:diacylglycerol kinase family protein [Ohtaekwangia sp.]
MPADTPKILFVINPSAGRTGNDKAILSIHSAAAEEGFDFKFLYTQGQGDEKRIAAELKDYRPERVIACGGDGTVQLVAGVLMKSEIPMGILPLGSANGLAKALGVSLEIESALDLAIHAGKSRPMDLLKINDKHLCIHLSDIGTNALLVKHYEDAGDKGMIGYAKHLLKAIQDSELMRYTIVTPEGTFEKEGFMLAVANANKYGTGVHISQGSVSDGKFEVCNVQKIDMESAIKAGLTALNIFVDKDMFRDVISCKRAEITIDRKVHWQVDGEYLGEIDFLKIEILESAIRLLV